MSTAQLELKTLLDCCEKQLESSTLPASIFNNEAVFAAEMKRIFGRVWVFLGFDSEIPNKGDYVLRQIGLDSVIVVRDETGTVNVLSNHCRHRGTEICYVDQGNASHFRCPYHGWVYRNNGDWQTAPHVTRAYRELDPKQWGLFKAPHVEVFHGLIFASLADDAPSLRDELGGAAWMLDACFGLHPDGMRVIGPPDRWRIKSDWKVGAENFGGDNYHADTVHVSLDDVGMVENLRQMVTFISQYDLGNGHIFTGHDFLKWFGPGWDIWGYPQDLIDKFSVSGLDEAQRSMLSGSVPVTGTIFPNLTYLRFPGSPDPGVQPLAIYTSLRQWQPVAPGVMELWSWQLTWNAASNEYTKACYAAGQNAFSSSGVFEQDDTAAWEGIPRAAKSEFPAQQNDMTFNYQLGHEGMSDNPVDETWQGPGVVRRSGIGEQNQRSFYQRWLKEMQREC